MTTSSSHTPEPSYPKTLQDFDRRGVEAVVYHLLPMPTLEVLALFEHLLTDVTTSQAIPMALYDEAIPEYLSTGRPFSMIEQRYGDIYSVGKLRKFIKRDPSLCQSILSGLDAGLAKIRLLRASSHQTGDSAEAKALASISKMVEADIDDISGAVRLSSRKAKGRSKSASEQTLPNSSWADDIIEQAPRPADSRSPRQPIGPKPTTERAGDTAPAPSAPATPAAYSDIAAQSGMALIPADQPPPAHGQQTQIHVSAEAIPDNTRLASPIETVTAETRGSLAPLDLRSSLQPEDQPDQPSQYENAAAAGFAQPSTVSTPTALSGVKPAPTPAPRQNPHATNRLNPVNTISSSAKRTGNAGTWKL